ncbi:MAG: DUF4243 domain-containing protein [Geodermatophilaceae bacterium]|nr:DUF4243 domain-containing protein [Geodermatophilaceae bacterium]
MTRTTATGLFDHIFPKLDTGSGEPAANSDTLSEAFERLHRSGPEFGGDEEGNHGLTNHGPMAAEVIVRRGLDLNVHQWLTQYMPRLTELPASSERVAEDNWQDALGDGRRIGDWTAYFARQVAERPWRSVLSTWWPRLLPGIAAGSTHGVIRVGHAVRALAAGNHSQPAVAELAFGLAFWAARARSLPSLAVPAGDLPAAAALAGVPRLPDQSGLIAHRLDRLADLTGWAGSLAALRRPAGPTDVPARLSDLVDVATFRYLGYGHGSPVLLVHTATAPNAVLHCLPTLPERLWMASFGAAWAATAALTATYCPRHPAPSDVLPTAPKESEPDVEALDRAARHGDEHVMKFTDTAVEVFERTGNPDALAAATRSCELIDSTL